MPAQVSPRVREVSKPRVTQKVIESRIESNPYHIYYNSKERGDSEIYHNFKVPVL